MFKKSINKKNITFTDMFPDLYTEYLPEPANKNIPKWYKKTPSYHSQFPHTGLKEKLTLKDTPATIKRCMPVYDALSAGYYIYTSAEIAVTTRDGMPFYLWSVGPGIDFHGVIQNPIHPKTKDSEYNMPKFLNRWIIKTPPGYSTMFVNPIHNPNNIFTIFEGIVDTDKYLNTVHFPFTLNDKDWTGIIPAGTIIAQVIPFKRDNWEMSFGKENEIKEAHKVSTKVQTHFFDVYKNFFRSEKSFK